MAPNAWAYTYTYQFANAVMHDNYKKQQQKDSVFIFLSLLFEFYQVQLNAYELVVEMKQ